MRFVRLIAGLVLLTIGLPVFFAGGVLWNVARHRDPGGAFGATLQQVETPGRAVVVPDLDALLHRDAPFARLDRTGLRIIARTGADPAFVGIAPINEVSSYLAATSYARIDRVSLAIDLLPARVAALGTGSGRAVGNPGEQEFWVRHGVGVLDLDPEEFRGRRLSLVIMHPDARAGVDVGLRAEVRPGWLDPAAWGLLAAGIILVTLGMAALAWPVRPREVVFVVEPSQLPGLAARLGVPVLDDLGRPGPTQPGVDAGSARPESGAASTRRRDDAVPALDLVSAPASELDPAAAVDLGVLPAAPSGRSVRPASGVPVEPARPAGPWPSRPVSLACLLTNEGPPPASANSDSARPPGWPLVVPPGVRPVLTDSGLVGASVLPPAEAAASPAEVLEPPAGVAVPAPVATPIRPAPTPAKPVPGRPAPAQPAPDRPGQPDPVRPVPAKPAPVRSPQPVPARAVGEPAESPLVGTASGVPAPAPAPVAVADSREERIAATPVQTAAEPAGRAATKRRKGYRLATGSSDSESAPVLRASSPGPDREADSARRRTGGRRAGQTTSRR